MLEALIAVPFFVLVFACIQYAHRLYSRGIALESRVRACTWAYATGGCDRLPVACEGLVVSDHGPLDAAALPRGDALTAFESLPPVEGLLPATLGEQWVYSGSDAFARPQALGGVRRMHLTHSMMCNEPPPSAPDATARRVLCATSGLCD